MVEKSRWVESFDRTLQGKKLRSRKKEKKEIVVEKGRGKRRIGNGKDRERKGETKKNVIKR